MPASIYEFRSKISTGSRWDIAGNAIVDIEEWIESHPGGANLLRLQIGLNVTKQLIVCLMHKECVCDVSAPIFKFGCVKMK